MTTVEDRVKELSHIPKECLREDPPMPNTCKIEVSSVCEGGCNNCLSGKGLRKTGLMYDKVFKNCLTKIAATKIKGIGMFLLGDALIHPQLYELIEIASRRIYCGVFMTVNASRVSVEQVRDMYNCGLSSLKFSLDETSPEFDAIYYASGYCYASDYSIEVSCSMIVKGKEPDSLQRAWELKLKRDGIPVYYLPLHSCAGLLDNGGRGCPGTWDNPAPLTPCYPLFRGFYVDWRGRNTLCPICHDEKFLNGSLLEHTVEELWYSEFARDLRRQHLTGNITHPSCRRCLGYGDKDDGTEPAAAADEGFGEGVF